MVMTSVSGVRDRECDLDFELDIEGDLERDLDLDRDLDSSRMEYSSILRLY